MGNTPSDQSKQDHISLVVNAWVNLIMMVVITSYFIFVTRSSKVRSNWQGKTIILLIGIAFAMRVLLSFYDCQVTFSKMSH